MTTIILAITIGAYGATAILVAVKTWQATPKSEVDDAVAWAQMHVSPLHQLFTPIVARTARPAWAISHGLLWPLVLIAARRNHQS